jgi:aminoglycoside 3-N-acetyltransferase
MGAARELAKARLRDPYLRLRRSLEPLERRVRGTLDRDQLGEALRGLGVEPGACVMAHISMDEVGRVAPEVGPLDLIALLKELLTEEGTLLIPTFPFTGFEADYVASDPAFDVRRTPSQMGLVTELFRRMPDTTRSLHPTHPVAGWGAHAAEILSTHHEGETFGEGSPFCRMREWNGLVVGIGVVAITHIHCAEYLHPEARSFAFAKEPKTLKITDGERTFDYTFHPLRRRGLNLRRGEAEMIAAGMLTRRRPSGLIVSAARADATIDWCCRRVDEGIFYDRPLPVSR